MQSTKSQLRNLLSFTLLLLIQTAYCQHNSYNLKAAFNYGFVGDFYSSVSHLANQHVPGFDLEIYYRTYGKHKWHNAQRYPYWHFGFTYFRFDKNKPLGDCYIAQAKVSKDIIANSHLRLNGKLGAGFCYTNKTFDLFSNPSNNMISSRLSVALGLNLDLYVRLSKNLSWQTGIGLFHASNGSYKLPNMGINLPFLQTGLIYQIGAPQERIENKDTSKYKYWSHFINIAGGLNEMYPVRGPKYGLLTLTYTAEYRSNAKSGLHIGVDASYSAAKGAQIEIDSSALEDNFANRTQLAIIGGHEWYFGNLSIQTYLGIYIYNPTHSTPTTYYEKIGLKYHVTKHLFFSGCLKAHLGSADWIEVGGGIRL